jgi:hypothetical protein
VNLKNKEARYARQLHKTHPGQSGGRKREKEEHDPEHLLAVLWEGMGEAGQVC